MTTKDFVREKFGVDVNDPDIIKSITNLKARMNLQQRIDQQRGIAYWEMLNMIMENHYHQEFKKIKHKYPDAFIDGTKVKLTEKELDIALNEKLSEGAKVADDELKSMTTISNPKNKQTVEEIKKELNL